MSLQKNEHYSKFWFGFAVGAAICGGLAVAFGTKQGRKMLQETVTHFEKIETSEDHLKSLTDTMFSFFEEVIDTHQAPPTPQASEQKKPPSNPPQQGLNSIIEKMKNITNDKKTENKFFVTSQKK